MKIFDTNIINFYGDWGNTWLADLSKIVDQITEKWGLSDLTPASNMTYILFCFQGAQSIVLILASSPESVLLHGDLHYDNILKNGEGWLVIAPKGVIGTLVQCIMACYWSLEDNQDPKDCLIFVGKSEKML
jgi:hypothetical protein